VRQRLLPELRHALRTDAQEALERAEKEENAAMRVLKNDFGWSLIDTAPFDEDVMLEVTDGQGERYRLRNPCRLTASGWVSSSKERRSSSHQ
jgi:hypothetical protein